MSIYPLIRLRFFQLTRKLKKPLILLALLALVVVSISSFNSNTPQEPKSNRQFANYGHVIKDKQKVNDFKLETINQLLLDILEFEPKLEISDDEVEFNTDDNSRLTKLSQLTEYKLKEQMVMPNSILTELSKKNSMILKYLSNPDFIQPKFEKTGAVIVGGVENDATWSALMTVRVFRKMGGTIPIEVMIPTVDDYLRDKQICDKYFKELNAECYVLEERINLKRTSTQGSHYLWMFDKLKLELAILTSKFNNVLYLKPDVVILNPIRESLFNSKVFKDNGLIFWNDHDKRFTSPLFYSMANHEIQNVVKSSKGFPLTEATFRNSNSNDEFHDLLGTLPYRQTSDAMVLINKATHFKSLLLSIFYIVNGEGLYYPLLSVDSKLDSPTKSTLIAAAHILNLSYYQTSIDIETIGFKYIDHFQMIGNLHFDPLSDIHSMERFQSKVKDPSELNWDNYQNFIGTVKKGKKSQFLELTQFELKPLELFESNLMFKNNGDRIKVFDSEFIKPKLEVEIWKIMNDYICNYEISCAYLDRHFLTPASRAQFCNGKLKNHIMWLESH